MSMLKTEFPDLEFIRFGSSVSITYFRRLPAWLKIFLLSPFLGFETIREHFRLRKLLRRTRVDLVISDNRYGLWHTSIPSVLITHQLNPRIPLIMKFMELPIAGIIRLMIKQFHRCWVPDFPGEDNLSGDLSHKYTLPRNVVFTGPLSRFIPERVPGIESDVSKIPHKEVIILISGPEPQRTKLENIILDQAGEIHLKTVILRGLPGEQSSWETGKHTTVHSHISSKMLETMMCNARYIICRGGYTSIMDLVTLRKSAMIIPTPGQTEQEYLSDYLVEKGILLSSDQKNLDLSKAIQQLDKFHPDWSLPESGLLDRELDEVLIRI